MNSATLNTATELPAPLATAMPKIVAYQGVPGAYSHLACERMLPGFKAAPCPSFADMFDAVSSGAAGLCMAPIENSLGGRVADIHHLLPDSGLHIVAEHFLPIHHCLMAPKGATLEGLREVHSHEQALSQCRTALRELGLKAVKAADTAGAAKYAAELGDPKVGAVASALAAKSWGLDVLRSRMENRLGNVTRFVVMSRNRFDPPLGEQRCLTSFVFALRSIPAGLYKALGGFATNGVNFVKLESYISVAEPDNARFYAEIEGHPAEKAISLAFDELHYFTNGIKLLGVYPQSPFRRQNKAGKPDGMDFSV